MHLNKKRGDAYDMGEENDARPKIVKRVPRVPLISVLHMVVDTVVRMHRVIVWRLIIRQGNIVRNMVVDIFVNIQTVKQL
jgi:hypothetical protein